MADHKRNSLDHDVPADPHDPNKGPPGGLASINEPPGSDVSYPPVPKPGPGGLPPVKEPKHHRPKTAAVRRGGGKKGRR
jgi:hypothetical protein